jgi:PEP-CTERM/exosortase A-associated glycosyltransferase
MRVLHILDHSLPVQSGYSFRSAAILREQRKLGIETVQVTSTKHDKGSGLHERVNDLEFYRTPKSGSILERIPVANQWEVVRRLRARLRELIESERPDFLHAHSPCLTAMAAIGLGKPVVYEMRSSWEDAAVSTGTTTEGSARYRISKALETSVLRRADAVTTICEGLREEVILRGVAADRVTVVPNAVDVEAFTPSQAVDSPMRAKHGLNGCFVLGFIGSFFAWEGLSLLIDAMPAVLAKRPDARLLLVGGGVHDPALRSQTERLGLTKQIVFAGQVPHKDVNAYYDAIDLLVYPRLPMRLTNMVTPLKPLECMALGKVQVASDVGGHRELIKDGETGVLFRAGDPAAAAASILAVMDNPALRQRLSANGPEFVRAQRTWGAVVKRYVPLYERILAGTKS